MRWPLLFLAALPITPAFAIDALILHGVSFDMNYARDVQANLAASGQFAVIDAWAGDVSAPTARDLSAYDVVLTMPDAGWVDPAATGEALATFVDNGGAVVDSVFSFAQYHSGRFYSDGYLPTLTYSPYGVSSSLGNFRAGHPVMAGVQSFEDSTFHSDTNVAVNGADQIAAYNTGSVLVAGWAPTGAGNVVAINFYPPSGLLRQDFWNPLTDGARLLVNALVEAATGSFSADFSTHVAGACGGPGTLNVQNATANGRVAIVSGGAGRS